MTSAPFSYSGTYPPIAVSPMPVPVTEKTGTRGLFCTRSFSDRCMKYSPSLPTRHVPSITAERGGSVA